MIFGMGRIALVAQASSAALAVAALSQPAMAQTQTMRFDIPAQPLGEALQAFSKQSGYRLLFPSANVASRRAPAVVGSYAAENALARILDGSPLRVASINGRVVALTVREAAGNTPHRIATPVNFAPSAQVTPEQGAGAAPAPAAQDIDQTPPAEVVVVGSQIKGAKVNDALPVTLIGQREIQDTGAVSGDELFRSVPQFGDVTFNSAYLPQSSNAARGDIGSVNLRNLGIGNTLVLLNGRRVVNHPTSQANDQLVPVLTYNTNAIPVNGLERLEVLRDGAAAIYGADAVAGVVNTILKTNYNGGDFSVQYGGAEGTRLRELNVSGVVGTNFAGGRGNITLFGAYDRGTGLMSTEQYFTASSDRRGLFANTRFAGKSTLDGRSTATPWLGASVITPTGFGAVKANGTSVTTAAGAFQIQPSSLSGCNTSLGNGLCVTSGALNTALKEDAAAEGTSIIPRLNRVNLFLTGHYDFDDVTAFWEAGYYRAKTHAQQNPISTLSSIPITVPASNYWNPFGPVTFADGSANPNRIPGLNTPAAGLPVRIASYSFTDFGPINVDVTNKQFRLLFGLRGEWHGFNWETAGSYSEATVRDVSDNISRTKLAQILALSTPAAYNPFNGGSLTTPSVGDGTPSNATSINAARESLVRFDKSTLATYDFRLSKKDLITLPGGDVGFASGIEARRETQLDARDPRINGEITYTDPLTGVVASDFANLSMNPSTHGTRMVFSAYGELAVPVVSPELEIPLVRSLNFQFAGRYENYSDFGDIAVPKVAGSWDVVKGIRLRGSWAKSFRAPNLEQVNAQIITRTNTRTDYIFCQADLLKGAIASFADCANSPVPGAKRRLSVTAQRSGNPDLDPERANTWSIGAVIEPPIPDRFGHLTLTADYWRVKQTGLIGIFGEGNALILDYLLRQSGQTNPNVVRAAPTADDIAAFNGTGLAPAGQVLYVKDKYVNLLPQTVRGLDLNAIYSVRDTGIGDFNISVNVSHLIQFYQDPSPGIAELLAARAAGKINKDTVITGGGSLLRQNSRPSWKWSASFNWSLENVSIGAFTQYIGSVEDTSIDAAAAPWVVDGQLTGNLYAEYRLPGAMKGASIRLGVRNFTNEAPSLSANGYLGTLYTPMGRYWYANMRYRF
ncbi:MAG: TonB-dependent receptor [Candidatus Sphingomonas colombiensis]|nr:TonB-dependent receptor [Sphingomonas sp.]WEK43730.1 MAG: TonB-dependent receptor [Sphingomonas sp.]